MTQQETKIPVDEKSLAWLKRHGADPAAQLKEDLAALAEMAWDLPTVFDEHEDEIIQKAVGEAPFPSTMPTMAWPNIFAGLVDGIDEIEGLNNLTPAEVWIVWDRARQDHDRSSNNNQ